MSEYRRELAFRAGRIAGLAGKPETANNRQFGTIFCDDWADGWQEGARAQAIEAQRAATVKQGAVHESAVAESDAPKGESS